MGGSFSAKTGVLRKPNPAFCAARAAIERRLLARLFAFGTQKPAVFNGRAFELFFAVPQGTPVISALVRAGIPTFLAHVR